jgi:Ca2+:H+ antiporter
MKVEESVLVALVLMAGYVLSLVWQFTNPERTLGGHGEPEGHAGPAWSGRVAVLVLVITAALLAVLSEILVGSIEPFIEQFGLSELFVGVILIPTIGNLAEHLVAVQLAYKNKIEFSLAVAFGSSLQVALFVAPVLVLLGLVVGQPMDLVFHPLEVAAVAAAVGISALVALDGESNWLEGALLVLVFAILAISFFEFQVPI